VGAPFSRRPFESGAAGNDEINPHQRHASAKQTSSDERKRSPTIPAVTIPTQKKALSVSREMRERQNDALHVPVQCHQQTAIPLTNIQVRLSSLPLFNSLITAGGQVTRGSTALGACSRPAGTGGLFLFFHRRTYQTCPKRLA